MGYIVTFLVTLIIMFLVLQIIFFELTRSKMMKGNHQMWLLSLEAPFKYNRYLYMVIVFTLAFLMSDMEGFLSVLWFLELILFIAIGIFSDIVVQYIVRMYGKMRCKKEIAKAKHLKSVIENYDFVEDNNYTMSQMSYDEKDCLMRYMKSSDHVALLTLDHGEFAKTISPLPEAMFDVEPFDDMDVLTSQLSDTPIKPLKLASQNKLPFKDEKIDIFMSQYANFDNQEVRRILKVGGYFIAHQHGTSNLKEIIELYMPHGLRGTWDSFSCEKALESLNMSIVDSYEDYGSIRFSNLSQVYHFCVRYIPDLKNVQQFLGFYMHVERMIEEKGFFELSTHKFLVIARKN